MRYFVILLVLSGFVGIAVAEHGELHPEPTPVCPEGTILKGDVCVKAEPLCGKGATYQNGICIVNGNDENTSSSGKWEQSLRNYTITSPLKQLHSGISPDKVVCEADLELVHKHNGLAACVTPETREKLIQRNWAVDFPMEYIIDYDYWGKTYLVHHTMCAHIGVEKISEEEAMHRFFWTMTDDDLEKIPIIKSMLEYNSHGLYSSDEYPITSTVVPDDVQNQYRQIFEELAYGEVGSWRVFWYDGTHYATIFLIC